MPDSVSAILLPAPSLSSGRYNRQLLVPQFRLSGQQNLLTSRVLIVGLGGLGSPAALYLAGAGIGTLGFMDADVVDVSNLHRQIVHTESAAAKGQTKVSSAIDRCRALNSTIEYRGHEMRAGEEGGAEFLKVLKEGEYEVVLDCTDNPATRYLISDACVVVGCVLVSGAAQKGEGQVVVLNSPPNGGSSALGEQEKGPCYRCVFPRPPPPEMVRGCSEIGVMGHVVGLIGTLMAGEVVKLVSQGKHLPHSTPGVESTSTTTSAATSETNHIQLQPQPQPQPQPQLKAKNQHTMLLYNTFAADPRNQFRTITLRGRRKDCVACGDDEVLASKSLTKITHVTIAQGRLDYVAFCGVFEDVKLLGDENRVDASTFLDIQRGDDADGAATEVGTRVLQQQQQTNTQQSRRPPQYGGLRRAGKRPIVVDVREEHEFELGAKVDGSVNIPISRILRHGGKAFDDLHAHPPHLQERSKGDRPEIFRLPTGEGAGGSEGKSGGMVDEERHIPESQDTAIVDGELKQGGMIDEESHIPVDQDDSAEDYASDEAGARPNVYFVCQRGNDSQIAAQKLLQRIQADTEAETGPGTTRDLGFGWVGDIKGGFVALERHEFGEQR